MSARLFLVPFVAISFVAAACGSDDSSSSSSAPATTEVTSTSPPETTESIDSGSFGAAVDAAAADFLAGPDANGATALYVSISDPDQGDVERAYGDAGVDGPEATVDDNFRIGSVTKSFTATVVLQLVDEGELALDDTVEDVLPDLAVDYPDLAPLTVEQLLSMQTGIADYLNVPDSVVADIVDDPTREWGIEELIAAGVDAGVEPPGTPGYSTTNYLVLQLMAEMVTDTPLRDLIDERITNPLELTNTFLPPNDDTALPEPATSGYVAGGCVREFEQDGATIEDGTDVTDWSASYGQGGGGMTSTISDLGSWGASLSGNELLPDDLAEARLEFTDIGGIAYGLGILQVGSWIGHEGEAIGWEAVAFHDPDTGVTVALAANGCGGVIIGFASILDTLYPDGGAFTALLEGPSLDAETGSETTTTDVDPDATSPSTTEAPEVPDAPSGGAAGTATFSAGDLNIEGEIVQCTIDDPNVDMVINGENSGIEVYSIADGEVGVIVSGMAEWEGRGQATINGSNVSIAGQGSPQGAGTATEDFTIEAKVDSC